MSERAAGTVYLVGAGPGDPELITVRGAELLGRADVVIYDGLANAVLLDHVAPTAETIYAGKKPSDRGAALTQAEINGLLVEHAQRGRLVVRLKGGDPFVFGRGGEEAEALVAAGIQFEVVPGVTAATAVPAYAGSPVTHRAAGGSLLALATGQGADGLPADVDWDALARADTLVLFMAVRTLGELAERLVRAGRDVSTPVAMIHWGTTAAQRTITGTLGDIAARAEGDKLGPPALVVVGEVVRLRERLAWYERRPLFGRRVLVPRQREQARGLARRLALLGAEPVICEVTRLVDVDPAPLHAALAALPGATRWLAFTSAHAVDRTMDALFAAGRDARAFAGVRVAAVGSQTAAALRRAGIVPDLVPERGDGVGVAAAILAVDPAVAAGGAVLVPRAAEGRAELEQALTAAGACVSVVAAYRVEPAPRAALEPVLARLRAGELDVLTFFAPSQVDALADALGADAAAVFARARLIGAVGETTATALRERGVRVDVVAAAPSADALADAILERLTARLAERPTAPIPEVP